MNIRQLKNHCFALTFIIVSKNMEIVAGFELKQIDPKKDFKSYANSSLFICALLFITHKETMYV